LLLSLLFANLSIYTHERYIVVFPFIVLLILLFPGLKRLGARSRILIGTIAIASAFANVAIKKYALGMSFFVGTASTKMTFSLSSIIPFLKDALKCIFQINTGNLGHTGSFFHDLPLWQKLLVLSLTLVFLVTLLGYTLRTAAAYRTLSKEQKTKFLVFLSLPVLLFFCLLPAVVTIRLEQRWLQAPFGIFLVMFVIAFSSIHFENTRRQNQAVAFFTLFFLAVNANYYYRGSNFLYLNSAQKCAAMFEKGTRSGVIRPGSGTLYIWSKPMNLADNAFVNWSIGGGYLFEFYQGKSKQLVFVDSAYLHTPGCYADIGKDSSQVISMSLTDYVVADLTRQFLKDSLKSLN
jgi:hypothetical protein